MKKLKKVFAIGILLLLPLGLTSCGATAKFIIHPITDRDIMLLDAGDTFVAPQSGAFLSDYYINKVMEAGVE